MARLATLGLLLASLFVIETHGQERLGMQHEEVQITSSPPPIALEIINGSRAWSDAETTHALTEELLHWLSENFSFPLVRELPLVTHATPETITAIRFRALLGRDSAAGTSSVQAALSQITVAIYVDNERTIYLPENFSGRTPAKTSILVHELVHYIQHVVGQRHDCAQAREKDAYLAQARWLQQFGKTLETEFEIDPFTVLINSLCVY